MLLPNKLTHYQEFSRDRLGGPFFVLDMILIGLTGGIGAGKSFLTDFLIKKSIPVIDTDVISRQLLEPEQSAWSAVKSHFGSSFFFPDGHLDRSKLASQIFSDASSKEWLNQLMHPMIRHQWKLSVSQFKELGKRICVVVIPLLFETDAHSDFDKIICMACSTPTQMDRLKKRGWDLKHIKDRVSSQWPMFQKMNASHYVIWTDCAKTSTHSQCELVLNQIQKTL